MFCTSLDPDKKILFLVLPHPSGVGEENISMVSCFKNGEIINYNDEIVYFTSLLSLFSSLCTGRNFICKSSINNWFPLPLILKSIWNEHLTPDIRASFFEMLMSMHIDFQPRSYIKLPEIIKTLNNKSIDAIKSTFKERHKILAADDNEVMENFAKKNDGAKGIGNDSKRSYDEYYVSIDDDQIDMFTLKCQLIDYLEVLKDPQFDLLLLQILKLSNMLVKFEVISTDCSFFATKKSLLSPLSKDFSTANMDLTKLLQAATKLLFIGNNLIIISKEALKKKNTFSILNTQGSKIISALRKNFDLSDDEFVRFYEGLRKYLESHMLNSNESTGVKNIEIECKLELCELLYLALNLRQDFLINNFIEWHKLNPQPSMKELKRLVPPLIKIGYGKKNDKQEKKFKIFAQPLIEPITFVSPTIIGDLFLLFTSVSNYELKTKVLGIILRVFSQRKEMTKNLCRVKIMTMENDPDIFLWSKLNSSTLRNLSEQSEIICKYWTQASSSYNETIQKIDNLNKLLIKFEDIMYFDSKIIENQIENSGKVISKDRQLMLKNLRFHVYVVNLIKDGLHVLEGIFEDPKTFKEKQAKEKLSRLFSLCFKTLSTFVYKNPKNQKALHKHLNIICKYLKISVGQIELLCEIFRDNALLCSSITESFLQQFIELIITEGRQSIFLSFFEVVAEVNGLEMPNVQRTILMLMCQPMTYHHVCYLDDHEKFAFSVSSNNVSDNYIDQPFVYHSKLIQVLTKCGTSSSGFHIMKAKCQKIIPIDAIFELLAFEGEYRALEYPLLDFFFKIYLCSETSNEEVENNKQFFNLIKIKTHQLQKVTSENEINTNNIEKWIEVIEKYASKYTENTFYIEYKNVVVEYLNELESKLYLFKNSRFSQVFQRNFETLARIFGVQFSGLCDEKEIELVETSPRHEGEALWNNIIDLLSDSKMAGYIKEERRGFLQALFSISEFDSGIQTMMIIECMMEYISLALIYKPPADILASLIRFLSFYLKEPQKIGKETEQEARKRIQNEFSELGIVNIILSLICDQKVNEEVFSALISFSIALLEGGNQKVQKDFYDYFVSYRSSEIFFCLVQDWISKHISFSAQLSDSNIKSLSNFNKSSKIIKNIIRLLQLFCENHNEVLQNYIRVQVKSQNTYDLIGIIINLLHELIRKKRLKSFYLISGCFDTLTELIQGPCRENQKAIINSKFLEIASNLLSLDEYSDTLSNYKGILDAKSIGYDGQIKVLKGWMVSHIKYKAAITLLALFEGETDNYIITRMARTFNIQILKENLLSIYKAYIRLYKPGFYEEELFNHFQGNESYNFNSKANKQDLEPEKSTFIIETGFLISFLMYHFNNIQDPEIKKIISNEIPEISDLIKKIAKKFDTKENPVQKIDKKIKIFNNSYIGHTDKELLRKAFSFFLKNSGNVEIVFNGVLCASYFWLHPICLHLTKEVKENFHKKVDRSSHKKKIIYLVSQTDEMIKDMRYEEKLRKAWGYKYMTKQIRKFKHLVFLLSIAINAIILVSYSDYNTDRMYGPSFFNVDQESINYTYVTSTTNTLLGLGIVHCILSGFIFLSFIIKTAPILIQRLWLKQETLNQDNQSENLAIKYTSRSKIFLMTFYYALSNIDILYHLTYFGFSVLAVCIHPFFFSVHLIDIIYRSPTSQSVVMAVANPWKSLLLTLVFILVIVYLFSVWAYFNISADFQGNCDSLLKCIKTVFEQGFKNSGGIGQWIDFVTPPVPGVVNYQRLFFDNLHTIILLWIMLNIVQGIIIVTFAAVREAQKSNYQDINNKCFICGKEKEEIERLTGRILKYHRTYEHNEWSYCFFLTYLKLKEDTEYSGIESYVQQLVEAKNINWVPQQQSISFQYKQKIEEIKLNEDLSQIKSSARKDE